MKSRWFLPIAVSIAAGCARDPVEENPAPTPSTAVVAPAPSADPAPSPPPAHRESLTLLTGGDVSFGRLIGKLLLDKPETPLFAPVAALFASADLRFVNLESQLSDQKGETESPENPLVFTGPPAGAAALAGAGVDVVSLANNHAWDYGKAALFETFDHLERARVKYVGAGRDRAAAYAPVILEREGFRIALVAVTDIWNQGVLSKHKGAEFVAGADPVVLAASVRALKSSGEYDAVLVSYHGGCEYVHEPITKTRDTLRAAIDAGADAVIGHHPHVVQGVEWRGGHPILYSLGNFLMRMHSNHPWTGMGYLARIRLTRGAAPAVEACPFRIHGIAPLPFPGDPLRDAYERQFFDHLIQISKSVGGTAVGPSGEDGCALLGPPGEPPAPRTAAR